MVDTGAPALFGVEAYRTYLAIKQHFTTSYDYFRYNGVVSAKDATYLKRRDKYFFKLMRKKHRYDLAEYLVALVVNDVKLVPASVCNKSCEDLYIKWQAWRESMSYNFKTELTSLLDWWYTETCDDDGPEPLNNMILVRGGTHPPLLKYLIRKEITIESFIILDSVLNISKYWNEKLGDDIVWAEKHKFMEKYRPFMEYEVAKMTKICKDVLYK